MSLLGIRARATLLFGLVAAMLVVLAGTAVWFSVASYLLSQRQEVAVAQAVSNHEQVDLGLSSAGSSPPQVLAQLPRQLASTSLLRTPQDEWFTDDLTVDRGSIPASLVDRVASGRPYSQRTEVAGRPALVVGLPVGSAGGTYFEVFFLDELDETLRTLSLVLLLGGLVLPLAGLALGWWVMRPALRPLEQVADAVAAIAAGDVGARLDARGDPSLRSIAESFNVTAAALERRVKMDAKFAADVSHELRSPLTTMVNTVHLVDLHRDSMAPEAQEALDLLHAEVDGFQRLVQDLLEISRADAGSHQFTLVEFRLADLVQRALPARLSECLEVTSSGAEAVVYGDKRRLVRVLTNLVDNADRHGHGVHRVVVDATAEVASLAVEDGGSGLMPRELEGIFDRFSRGRGSERGSTDGAGLGLALVAQHVRLMGGTVTAENRAGGGARFVVRLPRSRAGATLC
ncbi:HAMP domain-containing sensor histidine kinase [Nocardioides bigeumensis]|uniref:histidine kinase n=1 Tax=Nocardioides bigeumensis TaxID=433657 RepID=A0ABN2XPX8_9ACTN